MMFTAAWRLNEVLRENGNGFSSQSLQLPNGRIKVVFLSSSMERKKSDNLYC